MLPFLSTTSLAVSATVIVTVLSSEISVATANVPSNFSPPITTLLTVHSLADPLTSSEKFLSPVAATETTSSLTVVLTATFLPFFSTYTVSEPASLLYVRPLTATEAVLESYALAIKLLAFSARSFARLASCQPSD